MVGVIRGSFTRIEDGISPTGQTQRNAKKFKYNTHDPAAYTITINPAKNPEDGTDGVPGGVNFFFQKYFLDELGSDAGGGIELKSFAPGIAFEASLNEPFVRTHAGVGGEILRTFPAIRRGTITIHLFSHSLEAKALSILFLSKMNEAQSGAFTTSTTSPIGSIVVTVNSDKTSSERIVEGRECWLLKVPDFKISEDTSIATFVFDCTSLMVTHGGPAFFPQEK